MHKEDLSIDITFNPCQFSLDSPFKVKIEPLVFFLLVMLFFNPLEPKQFFFEFLAENFREC